MKHTLLIAAVALLVGGCSIKRVEVDGFSIYERPWQTASDTVSRQAAFDLQCPAAEIKLTVINADGVADDVGATGCGKQMRYTRVPNTMKYVANASTTP